MLPPAKVESCMARPHERGCLYTDVHEHTWLMTFQKTFTVAVAAAAPVLATLLAWKWASCAKSFSSDIVVPHVLQPCTSVYEPERWTTKPRVPCGDSGTSKDAGSGQTECHSSDLIHDTVRLGL